MLFILCLFFCENSIKCAHGIDMFDKKVNLTKNKSGISSSNDDFLNVEAEASASIDKYENPSIKGDVISDEPTKISSFDVNETIKLIETKLIIEYRRNPLVSESESESVLPQVDPLVGEKSEEPTSILSSEINEIIKFLETNPIIGYSENTLVSRPRPLNILPEVDALERKEIDVNFEKDFFGEKDRLEDPNKFEGIRKKEENKLSVGFDLFKMEETQKISNDFFTMDDEENNLFDEIKEKIENKCTSEKDGLERN